MRLCGPCSIDVLKDVTTVMVLMLIRHGAFKLSVLFFCYKSVHLFSRFKEHGPRCLAMPHRLYLQHLIIGLCRAIAVSRSALGPASLDVSIQQTLWLLPNGCMCAVPGPVHSAPVILECWPASRTCLVASATFRFLFSGYRDVPDAVNSF